MALIIFCGQSSYPRKDSAPANRYLAIAEITAELGHDVVFVNRHPALRLGEEPMPARFAVVNASGERRIHNWLIRQIVRPFASLREAFKILWLGRANSIAFINVYSEFAGDLILYFIVAKLVRAICIIHVVEHRSHIVGRAKILRLNDIIFEAMAPRIFNRFVAISSLLRDSIIKQNPGARVAVIPPVCHFDSLARISKNVRSRPYFLYCASLAYEEVAWFVIEAFLSIRRSDVDLILVLNGVLSTRIREACDNNNSIKVFSKVDYEALIAMYKGALALLIPLRDTVQDCARYPQKITEYLASGRPIISCKAGEIGRQFVHGRDALLAEHYDIHAYADMMRLALDDSIQLEEIANRGHSFGLEMFDIRSQQEKLLGLLK